MSQSGRFVADSDWSSPADRREQVRRLVLSTGFARTEELARQLGVSVMTVHRDLDVLATEDWLTKIRGGATANPSALALLPHLSAAAQLTVTTNFLTAVAELAGLAGVEVVVLGGRYHRLQEACFGLQTEGRCCVQVGRARRVCCV